MTKDFAQLIADNVHDHYFKFFLSEMFVFTHVIAIIYSTI